MPGRECVVCIANYNPTLIYSDSRLFLPAFNQALACVYAQVHAVTADMVRREHFHQRSFEGYALYLLSDTYPIFECSLEIG